MALDSAMIQMTESVDKEVKTGIVNIFYTFKIKKTMNMITEMQGIKIPKLEVQRNFFMVTEKFCILPEMVDQWLPGAWRGVRENG